MVRPCYLVVDPEHSGSISTRKLVIETAKLNVITAYSGREAMETLRKFPLVDGIVANAELHDISAAELVEAIKELAPSMPVIVVGAYNRPDRADYHVESFDPRALLDTLQSLQHEKVAAITQHEDKLRADE